MVGGGYDGGDRNALDRGGGGGGLYLRGIYDSTHLPVGSIFGLIQCTIHALGTIGAGLANIP